MRRSSVDGAGDTIGWIDEATPVAEARRALTDVDDPWGLAHIDAAQGMIVFVASDLTAAGAAYARSAAAYHAAGDPGTAGPRAPLP